jgi:hypothetical protein
LAIDGGEALRPVPLERADAAERGHGVVAIGLLEAEPRLARAAGKRRHRNRINADWHAVRVAREHGATRRPRCIERTRQPPLQSAALAFVQPTEGALRRA